MGSPQTIDLAALLAPLPDDSARLDLRKDHSPDAVYFRLKDARAASRNKEKQADSGLAISGLPSEWRSIAQLAQTTLQTRSKDIEVTAWLIEALARTDGFAGLRDGFRLARGLLEEHWDTLSFAEGEDSIEAKLRPLMNLNDAWLLAPMRKAPLTDGSDGVPLGLHHYEQACALDRITDSAALKRKIEGGAVTLAGFSSAAKASGAAFYVSLLEDIQAALVELEMLDEVLRARAGLAAPATSTIRDTLFAVERALLDISKDIRPKAPVEPTERPLVAPPKKVNGQGSVIPSIRAVQSREEALEILLQIADYFRAAEPHSPICNSLEEVVRRARLPFADLMKELLTPDAWKEALNKAGIKPPADQS